MNRNRLIYVAVLLLAIWLGVLTYQNSKQKTDTNPSDSIVNNYNVTGFSTDFSKIVEKSRSSIVTIDADKNISSGFIYTSDDSTTYILCTYHGVDGANSINVILDNNYSVSGQLLDYDIFSDIAILKADIPFKADSLKMGNSSLLNAGEFVICIGTPVSLEYKGSVELGMISNSLLTIENSIMFNSKKYNYYADMIQLSANLLNGYSGSPILNMNGEAVGIVTMSYKDEICFALPINEAVMIADKIMASDDYTGKVQLGIKGTYVEDMQAYEKTNYNISIDVISGLYVNAVNSEAVGYQCGIRSGDVIVSINGVEMKSQQDYLNVSYNNEKVFEFVVIRNNEEVTLTGSIND